MYYCQFEPAILLTWVMCLLNYADPCWLKGDKGMSSLAATDTACAESSSCIVQLLNCLFYCTTNSFTTCVVVCSTSYVVCWMCSLVPCLSTNYFRDKKGKGYIVAAEFDLSSKFFAACTDCKQLLVWTADNDWTLYSTRFVGTDYLTLILLL